MSLPMYLPRLLLAAVFLLPLTATGADFENVIAAVTLRSFDSELRFEDGSLQELRFRRAGIEYWEGVAEHVYVGFALGYSESEGREPLRPFAGTSGNYGRIGLRFDVPVTDMFSLRGRTGWLLQRDLAGAGSDEFEARSREVRAELGPVLHFRRLEFSLGGVWRDLDYREIRAGSIHANGETVRYAEGSDTAGGFAAFGWHARDGVIALRYDTGAEQGWGLRFERTF